MILGNSFCLRSEVHRDSVPELTFDIDTADFGVVLEGDSVEFDFWFTNTGTKPLEIRQAWPACGCTYPTYTKGSIDPGERGQIHVVFHSKNFGSDTLFKQVIIINNGAEKYANFKVIVVAKDKVKEYKKLKKLYMRQAAKKGRKRR